MEISTTMQLRKKESLTLPVEIRAKYHLDEGDVFSLIDLGDVLGWVRSRLTPRD